MATLINTMPWKVQVHLVQNINQTNKRNVETYIYNISSIQSHLSITNHFLFRLKHINILYASQQKSVTGHLENLKYQTKRQILPFLLDSPASFDRKVWYQLLQLGCRWPSWSSRKKRTRLSLAFGFLRRPNRHEKKEARGTDRLGICDIFLDWLFRDTCLGVLLSNNII